MLHPIFKLRNKPTEGIIKLLSSVSLGTNGAHYAHLDTRERILEADNPLFLSMERNEKTLSNVTFCRREKDWYVRYFAFDNSLQSGGRIKSSGKGNSFLKKELEGFFNETFELNEGLMPVDSFYAYIDPANSKSLWLSESFGFKTIGKIATQTFSRSKPKCSSRMTKIVEASDFLSIVRREFSAYNFYYESHVNQGPYFALKSNDGEILACAKIYRANWRIHRLPGKLGGAFTKLIPWIPIVRRIVNPKNHMFLVPEAVWVKDKDAKLLEELFEAILAEYKLNLIIWWADEKNHIYQEVQSKVKWGILNKLVGIAHANVVVLDNPNIEINRNSNPIYTIGFDFI